MHDIKINTPWSSNDPIQPVNATCELPFEHSRVRSTVLFGNLQHNFHERETNRTTAFSAS